MRMMGRRATRARGRGDRTKRKTWDPQMRGGGDEFGWQQTVVGPEREMRSYVRGPVNDPPFISRACAGGE